MPGRRRPPPRQRPSRLRPLLMAPSKIRNVVNTSSHPSRPTNPTRTPRCCIERLLNPSPTLSRSGHETFTPAAPSLVTPIPPVFTSPAAVPPARAPAPHGGAQLDARHPSPQEHGPRAADSARRCPARERIWPEMDEKERSEMEYTAAIMLSLRWGRSDRRGEGSASAAGSEEVGRPVGMAGSGGTIREGAGGASSDGITAGSRSGAMQDAESIRSRMRIERLLVDG